MSATLESFTKYSYIIEAVLYPEKIKVHSDNMSVDALNKKFEKLNILFTQDDSDALQGHFNHKDDIITINIPKRPQNNEIEAMIGHELIHREQSKRANGKFAEKIQNLVNVINTLADLANKSESSIEYETYLMKHRVALEHFRFGTAFEKMSYAYQFVKIAKSSDKPSDIIREVQKYIPKAVSSDKNFMKYIGMYYLIKDKI